MNTAPQQIDQIALTIEQIAQRYEVSTATISRWTAAGKFPQPAISVNRTRRWLLPQLQRFEQEQAGGIDILADPALDHRHYPRECAGESERA